MGIAIESGGAPPRPSASSALRFKTQRTPRTAEDLKKTKAHREHREHRDKEIEFTTRKRRTPGMGIAIESGGAPLRPSASSALNLKTQRTPRTAEDLKKTKAHREDREDRDKEIEFTTRTRRTPGMGIAIESGRAPLRPSASSALNLKTPGPA